jgi:hypothetical protein
MRVFQKETDPSEEMTGTKRIIRDLLIRETSSAASSPFREIE